MINPLNPKFATKALKGRIRANASKLQHIEAIKTNPDKADAITKSINLKESFTACRASTEKLALLAEEMKMTRAQPRRRSSGEAALPGRGEESIKREVE